MVIRFLCNPVLNFVFSLSIDIDEPRLLQLVLATEMASSNQEAILIASPPWTLKGTIYILMMYTTSSDAATLSSNPTFIYSSLEAEPSFSKSKLVGGLSMVQLIRYSESPVGPYDELIMAPGYFEYEVETKDKDGKVNLQKKENIRCSRLFVSQEKTCWNGRKSMAARFLLNRSC